MIVRTQPPHRSRTGNTGKSIVTIHDVARAAKVSLATVDRVFNRREMVRESTAQRVLVQAKRLGYRRNIEAANLAKNHWYHFALVVPAGDNPFMHQLELEAKNFVQHQPHSRTVLAVHTYRTHDGPHLATVLSSMRPSNCTGVALVGADTGEVRAAVGNLVEAGVPVVTLVSDVSSSQRQYFSGIDNTAAGRTAARLLGRFLGSQTGEIAVLAGSMLMRDHFERHAGFQQLFAQKFSQHRLLPTLECRDNDQQAYKHVRQLLAETPNLRGLYCIAAGTAGMLRALEEHRQAGGAHVLTVMHDLTAATRAALNSELIDAVIDQNLGKQVRSAMRVLRCLCDQVSILEDQERINIDIYLQDNMPT